MTGITVALIGNPNCGKTTLFNALTGSRRRVGNWSGVTVESQEGFCFRQGRRIKIVDLPGIYSLVSAKGLSSLDEQVTLEYLNSSAAQVIVNVIDAAHLERHLYLTVQLLEMGLPTVVVVNMIDVAAQRGTVIDIAELSRRLACPVVAIQANRKQGIEELRKLFDDVPEQYFELQYTDAIEQAIATLTAQYQEIAVDQRRTWALRCLEGDVSAQRQLTDSALVDRVQQVIVATASEDSDILIADHRYAFIATLAKAVISQQKNLRRTWTQRIDRWVLHRVAGIPIFLAVMYGMFFVAIHIGGAWQDFFSIISQLVTVDIPMRALQHFTDAPDFLAVILAGIGSGVSTTLTFIPVLAGMFFFLSLLENSGYMARAAFVVDRFMRAMGLPGKAFVPLIVGFGCNVPAIMGARTLDYLRDRILTVVMAPFMSCGARLVIYAVFIAAFFPSGGSLIVFSLYMIGIVLAIVTGLLLRSTLLSGDSSRLIMELPPYHWPVMTMLLLQTWQRLKGFLWRAGRVIVPVCALMTLLNTVTIEGRWLPHRSDNPSILEWAGKKITPVLTPLGISTDNWPATVGLVTGMLAKEVVIGTLNTLYARNDSVAQDNVSIKDQFLAACWSVPSNLLALLPWYFAPNAATTATDTLSPTAMRHLVYYFDGQAGAFAYLLFVLLYIPCVSTIAAIYREVSARWALFSVGWNTVIAYGTAVLFYQTAYFDRHPMQSLLGWVIGILFMMSVYGLFRYIGLSRKSHLA